MITAGLAGALLTGCVITNWIEADPLAPGEQSRLDEPGRERAKALGHLRLDLSDLCLTVEETGFPNPERGPIRFGSETHEIRVELIGPDGTLESTTRHLAVYPNDNGTSIDRIEWFVSEDTAEQSRARLETDAAILGLSDDDLELWDLSAEHVRSGEDESHLWTIGQSISSTGFVMSTQGNASLDNEVYIYSIFLNPAYNTPEVRAAWCGFGADVEPIFDDDWTC